MRSFVAITFDESIKRRLAETQQALRRADADVRWVDERNLHMTLMFLGEITEEQREKLAELLRHEASRYPPFEVDLAGVGTFPKSGPPRVIWAGCHGDVSKLMGLAGGVERAALQIGVRRDDRPFSAHLTIGRVKSDRNKAKLRNALEARNDDVFGRKKIGGFTLYRSTLTPEGPVYDGVETFSLSLDLDIPD